MESAGGVGPEASKKGIGASANLSAPDNLREPAFDEARSDSGSQSTGVTKRSDTLQKKMEEDRTRAESEEATYRWPPKKEDLEELYLAQRLSAMKISRVYGLKYPNPKSGETMVLWYLRKYGIQRRDKAEHIRKVTEEMVDEWVKRYAQGESLKQIAGALVDPVTVFTHLKRRGAQLRDRVEAQIKAVTKYQRKPFSGDPYERAYLLGFAFGDLHVSAHGRAVRVKTATTHPAMITLFSSLFRNYGHILLSPRRSRLVDFEWSLQVDLDSSFGFLSQKSLGITKDIQSQPNLFRSYLAGLFDAEGSITLKDYFYPRISLTNTNFQVLRVVESELIALGYPAQIRSQGISKLGAAGQEIWVLECWGRENARRFVQWIPIKHPEKVSKAQIVRRVCEAVTRDHSSAAADAWEFLNQRIKEERRRLSNAAHIALQNSEE
jgi:hypothetical protein